MSAVKQPDRFARAVSKREFVIETSCHGGDPLVVHSMDARTLLRREHAAVVRIVKQELLRLSKENFASPNHQTWVTAKQDALNDLLAALKRRKK